MRIEDLKIRLHPVAVARLQWMLSAVFIFLQVCLHVDAQTSGGSLCIKAKECGDCIMTGPHCAWCSHPHYQSEENFPRCDNVNVLRERGCTEEFLENPLSNVTIGQDTPLSTAGDPPEDLIQVFPQEIRLKMRPGETIPVEMLIRQAEDFPVDLYYLMDLSDSMSDDLVQLRSLGGTLAEEMKKLTRNFRLGYGAFIDKTVMPYIDITPAKITNPCLGKVCGPAFSFHNVLPLTNETARFSEEVSKVESSGNMDSPEGGMDAMMQASVCTDVIGWRDRARHLLVYTTDSSFHIAGDGKLGGIVKPNDGRCHMSDDGFRYTKANEMDYPSISELSQKLDSNDIYPIFAIGKAGDNKLDPFVFYEDLPQYFKEAKAARLSADSSNIVDLIKNIYLNITSAVTVVDDANEDLFDVGYTSHCLDGNVTRGSMECQGLKLGDTIKFEIDVTMKAAMCDEEATEHVIQIGPTAFNEYLRIFVEPLCDCDCADSSLEQVGPDVCNGLGTLVCGGCICQDGYSGRECECDRAEAEGLDPMCVAPNSTTECSGRGTCICGQCECDTGGNPNRVISGAFCQCDNFLCPRTGGLICGGSDKGTCECNEKTGKNFCECAEGYEGNACECPTSNSTCRAANGEICNGVGECVCGRCRCLDPKYSGATCSLCQDCPGECTINQPCVQCRAFHSGPYNKTLCKNCPHPVTVVDTLQRAEGHTECRFEDDDGCYVIFTYETLPSGEYYLEVQKEKICPGTTEMLWVILGIIIGIFLVGLALLLILRLLTYIHDTREFKNFEKERANATWEAGENPIYKPSTSVFKNPTYNIK